MTLLFGVRPFDFSDFIGMIEKGQLDISRVNYVDVVKATMQEEFKHFEITSDLAFVLPGLITENTVHQLKDLTSRNKYTCSVHLPLWGIELASPNSRIREASINCLVEAIELTKQLDPVCWVIHATGELASEFTRTDMPGFIKEYMTKQFSSTAQESLESIIDRTDIPSRKLAIENVEFPFREMEECLEILDLSVCFDTGHLLAGYSGEWENGVVEFFENYHDRIVELHLHDGTKPRIDHTPLGRYDLPVRELFDNLLEKKFPGPIIFELRIEEVRESMHFLKKILHDI
ncbi:MAG: cobamide remodeling phosphodiesterase CbiR [Candidatus Hodarchaeales archaeon]|jgi:sugar phosphate isomerase/epimerase